MKSLTLACLFLFAGCASPKPAMTPAAMPATLNTVCILTSEPLDPGSPTVDYMGKKIGFCCDNCVAKWNGMEDSAKQAAIAALKK